jgi:hypothetical protein
MWHKISAQRVIGSLHRQSQSQTSKMASNGYRTPSDDESVGSSSPIEVDNNQAPGKHSFIFDYERDYSYYCLYLILFDW